MNRGLHVNYSLFFSDFNKIWNFSIDFVEILKYQITWKSAHWETRFSMLTERQREGRTGGRTDRPTDITKLIIAFRNFASAPKYLLSLKELCKIRKELYTLKSRLPQSHLHWSLCFTPNPLQPRVLERTVIRTWKQFLFFNFVNCPTFVVV
jgi:UDP-galactopyranose mutase